MSLNINLILEDDYLEYILPQYNINFNIKRQNLEDKIIFDISDLPIIICDKEEKFYYIERKYLKDRIILLGNHPQNDHPYKINYPLKMSQLISLIKNLAEKKFFSLSENIILSQNQQLLYNNISNETIKLTIIETNFVEYLLDNNIINVTKEMIVNYLWPGQYIEQKNKNFDNLLYKIRKKLELFSVNIEAKNNYYYIFIN